MQEQSFQQKGLKFLKDHWLVSGIFLGGLIFLSIGLMQFFSVQNQEIQFQKGTEVLSASDSSHMMIMVDVSGEVQSPGVYKLKSDARMQDALAAAGGLSIDADRGYIAKSVNLASLLKDGMKVYIPKIGEVEATSGALTSSSATQGSASNIISINSSSQAQLEGLSGIGPVTAGKIIGARPYSSIDELVAKKVLGKSLFEKIKDSISL